MPTVAIAGITGKLARCVAYHLLQRPDVTLRGLCRTPSRLPASILSSPRVTIIQGQADDSDAATALVMGSDVVICCYLGDDRLMADGQKLLIDACEQEGVSRYVASDFTFDFTKLEYGVLPAKDPIKLVKDYVDATESVKGVHVLIGFYPETVFGQFLNHFDPEETKMSFWGTGDEVWEMTTYDTAAQYTAAVALDKDAVGLQRCM